MTGVDRVDEMAVKRSVNLLEVDDHAGLRVHRSADRHLDDVVMAVIGCARAEHLAIALFAPLRPAQDVRRGERGAPLDTDLLSQINTLLSRTLTDRGNFPQGSSRRLAPENGSDSGEASQLITRAT